MAIWAALKAVTLTLALTAISVVTITAHIERESHDDVAILANDVAQNFDHRMSQSYRMMEMAVGLDVLRDRWASPYQKSAALANLQITFADCLWIGLTDRQGIVTATGDGRREGSDAHLEPWFVEGSRRAMIGDLHRPQDMGLALQPIGEVERVIDLARPVRDPLGNVTGVLGASISWKWAQEFRAMLLRNRSGTAGIEILVTDRSGRILIGPSQLIDRTIKFAPDAVLALRHNANGMPAPGALDSRIGLANTLRLKVTAWPDDGDYISAVGTGAGYQDFPGLGWNIVVRQPRAIAYAPADLIRDRLVMVGIGLAVL
ncbi:MAG TPA: cache domain-containing protein, partial [Dongiaceae bacterium]